MLMKLRDEQTSTVNIAVECSMEMRMERKMREMLQRLERRVDEMPPSFFSK